MRRMPWIGLGGFWGCSLLFGVCLLATAFSGCRRESSAPKLPAPAEEIAKPEGAPSAESGEAETKATSGRDVFNRMIIAYREANTYADQGQLHLTAEAGSEKFLDTTLKFSLTFERPNKIRVEACQGMLVSNGADLFAAIEELPNQVVLRKSPTRITMKTIYGDRILAMGLTQGIGLLPQAVLLLATEPMKDLMRDAGQPELLVSRAVDGHDCYRVRLTKPEGDATFWVDQKTFLLRRLELPTDQILREIRNSQPVDRVSLVADFTGASIGEKVDPKAFAFEVPEGAEKVPFFILPHTAQLLAKQMPSFHFTDIDGKPVTPESLADKVTVLDFWASWCGPCKISLPNMQEVYEKYKDNPKVAFYAVSVDQPEVDNKDLEKVFTELKVSIPILRDPEKTAALFKFTGIPTTFIIGADGLVQDYEVGGNPNLTAELPEKIEKLLAGENTYEKPLKEYEDQLKQYAKMLEETTDDELAFDGSAVEERKLPEVKTAERTEPTAFKLSPLWKCADLKSPGNILVYGNKNEPPRLAVVENWKSVAEVGLDGKLIALHDLKLESNEVIGCLRSNVGADGRRFTAAFLTSQQRCHLLDENWNTVLSYPEDALKKPHSGIADVELGDLNGDGTLEMYVSYWGVVGVQCVSLDGKRLWTNRSLSNVIGMAIGEPDDKGQRKLYCTDNTGSLVVLDAQGERQGEVGVPNRLLHWIVSADLKNDGHLLWCGLSAPQVGENVAIGLTLAGESLWEYALPVGMLPQPIEPIIAGRVTREGPSQWIFPGADGSVHIVSDEGKLLDKFNSGVMLQGLATVEIDGQPAIVISSADGLDAQKVE